MNNDTLPPVTSGTGSETTEEPKRQAKRSHPLIRLYRATKEFSRHVEESPIVRLLVVLTVFFTAYQFWQGLKINQATLAEIREAQEFRKAERQLAKATFDELEESRRERRHESISRAWQRVNTKAPGNSGKVNAIEYLASEGISLVGIDLSCDAMGGAKRTRSLIDDKQVDLYYCLLPTYLRNLRLNGADVSTQDLIVLTKTDFSGADMINADLVSVDLTRSLFKGTDLERCQRRSKNPPLAGVKMYQFDGVGQSSLSAFSGAAVGCGAGRG